MADPSTAVYAPDPAGEETARAAVAGYYADQGLSVDPDQVILTASTSEAYAHLFRILGDPGDRFLAPVPSYPLFDPLAALEAVELGRYPLRHDDGWWIDCEAMEEAVDARTRGVILVHPNNPTGSPVRPGEAERIGRMAAERGLALIADEVFGDFRSPGDPGAGSFAAGGPALAFVLSGLSKVAGLPQMKLGWIVVTGPDELRRAALERLEWTADAFLSVGAPVQKALPRLLAGRMRFLAAARERLAVNDAWLSGHCDPAGGVRPLPWPGGWTAVLRVPRVRSEEDWCLALLERDVIVHPGHFYDFPDEAWLVVSLLVEPAVFQEGMTRLLALAAAG